MTFFVPYAPGRGHAEALWDYVRERLEDCGLPTTCRRIHALAFDNGGVTHLVAVGSDTIVAEDDPVLVILQARDEPDLVYVCTLSKVVHDELPFGLELDENWRVVDFRSGGGGRA